RHALLKERPGVGGQAALLLVHAFTLTDVRCPTLIGATRALVPVHPTSLYCPPSLLLSARERSCRNADHPDRLCVALRPCPRQLSDRLHQPPAAASLHRAAVIALSVLPRPDRRPRQYPASQLCSAAWPLPQLPAKHWLALSVCRACSRRSRR